MKNNAKFYAILEYSHGGIGVDIWNYFEDKVKAEDSFNRLADEGRKDELYHGEIENSYVLIEYEKFKFHDGKVVKKWGNFTKI